MVPIFSVHSIRKFQLCRNGGQILYGLQAMYVGKLQTEDILGNRVEEQ